MADMSSTPCFCGGTENIIRKVKGMFSRSAGVVRVVTGFSSCLRGDWGLVVNLAGGNAIWDASW